MAHIVFIGIGAGLAAALLFGSPIGNTVLALPLFALTGLPIAIAGLGWTPIAAATAALAGSAALFFLLSPLSSAVFLLFFGIPMTWLSRLAGLSRKENGNEEWFPLGGILVHAAAAVAIGLAAIGVLIGFNPDAMARGMADALSEWFANNPTLDRQPTRQDIEFFIDVNITALPYLLAATVLMVIVLDLWLGSIVTRTSGRLTRPKEKLWTISLPVGASATFVIAFAASFLPFPLGDVAALVAGSFGSALALLGLAVLHALTIGNNARTALLTFIYLLLIIFGFFILAFAALGLGETLFHMRARRFGSTPPPS